MNRERINIFSKLHSCALLGLQGAIVDVEVDVRNQGLPSFDLVGLPDTSVREARERVTLAIKNSGLSFPAHHVVINLAPADLRKEGSALDLSLALGVLSSSGQVIFPESERTLLIGELSLDGRLRPVSGVLSMLICAEAAGFRRAFLPEGNRREAALVKGIESYAFADLSEIVAYTQGVALKSPCCEESLEVVRRDVTDFADIRGQTGAKRALEVAAAGGHNLLMIGGPGAGKTLLARSLPSILPSLDFQEALQITQVFSVAGILGQQTALVGERPFRAPHHSITNAGLIGGGGTPRPGEVSLAHHGVLFLDELPEFKREVLELLRQPLEDRAVTIARSRATYTFPASFMLVASMNPCPCGYLGDVLQPCVCTETMIRRYRNRISGPLLDRIDLHIEVPRLSYDELNEPVTAEASSEIRHRVEKARVRQRERLEDLDLFCNAQMSGKQVRAFCALTPSAARLLRQSFDHLHLTARSHDRILKVARSIADLDDAKQIDIEHLAEAVSYRALDGNLK